MNCPKCGAVLQNEARFCPVCGQNLMGTDKNSSLNPKVPERKGLGGFKLLFLIALAVCGLVIWLGQEKSDPAEVVKQQLDALRNNKVTEAYYAYTSKDFQKITALDQFKEFIKYYPLLTQNNQAVDFTVKDGPEADVKVIEGDLRGPNRKKLPVEYQVILEDSKWKILYMRFATDDTPNSSANSPPEKTSVAQDLSPLNKDGMVRVVKTLLDNLKNNQIGQAYNSTTSKSFKDATSLEAFRHFLEAYPILTQNNSYRFGAYALEGSSGNVNVELVDGKQKASMNITLSKNDGDWKIQGIQHLDQSDNKPSLPEFNSKDLLGIIEGQLKALKQGELSRAYYDFTSDKFREQMTYTLFSKFINANPIFKFNKNDSFEDLKFDNNIANFTVTLTSTSGISSKVTYDMDMENGRWKILNIKILDKTNGSLLGNRPIAPPNFERVDFGTQVDGTGHILDPNVRIKAHQSDIYVNLYVNKAVQGDILQVSFEFLDNSTRIPVMAYTIPGDGDQMITFSFSPPQDGWPKGNYQIRVTSISGAEQDFPFKIE